MKRSFKPTLSESSRALCTENDRRGPSKARVWAGMTAALPIASFKLQFFAHRARVVPVCGEGGESYAEPGINLLGDEAAEAFKLSEPIRALLEARQPNRIRSLSVDVLKATLLFTVEGYPRPQVMRIDLATAPFGSAGLLLRTAPLLVYLGTMARAKLAARRG